METLTLAQKEQVRLQVLNSCGTDVPVHLQTGLQYYLKQRMDDLTVGNVCERCKCDAMVWGRSHYLKLEAEVGVCLAKAEKLKSAEALGPCSTVERVAPSAMDAVPGVGYQQ